MPRMSKLLEVINSINLRILPDRGRDSLQPIGMDTQSTRLEKSWTYTLLIYMKNYRGLTPTTMPTRNNRPRGP